MTPTNEQMYYAYLKYWFLANKCGFRWVRRAMLDHAKHFKSLIQEQGA